MLAAGDPLYGIDEELLTRLRPELIVTQAQCDVCAVRYADVVDFVARVPELAATRVVALNPMSLADVLLDVQRVADAAGAGERGRDVVAGLTRRVDSVGRATGSLRADERPRTAIIEWTEPLMLAGNWTPELLTLAGGVCPLATAGRHSEYVAWKQVREFDPEVIVVAPCGFDLERSMQEAAGLFEVGGTFRRTCHNTGPSHDGAAVRNRRVVVVDGNAYFNRSGPRLVESLEMLGHLLHPGRLPRPGWVEEGREPWRVIS